MTIASTEASFCLSEVKIGLIPAVISPYVIVAIGERAARRFFLTAEKFDAEEAILLGLIHKVVAPEELQNAGEVMAKIILLISFILAIFIFLIERFSHGVMAKWVASSYIGGLITSFSDYLWPFIYRVINSF